MKNKTNALRNGLIFWAGLALAAAPCLGQSAGDEPISISEAESLIHGMVAQAHQVRPAVPKSHLADLDCRPYPAKLDCVVMGEHRNIAISANPSRDHFRAIETQNSGRRYVELLHSNISHDYEVYYQFDEKAFADLVKQTSGRISGDYIENVGRMPRMSAPAVCTAAQNSNAAYYAFTGELDLATMALSTSRGPGPSPAFDSSGIKRAVDERCGALISPPAENFNYYVTPAHDWGEDIFQLPRTAPAASGAAFRANLHTCRYDGDWSDSDNVALQCSLTAR